MSHDPIPGVSSGTKDDGPLGHGSVALPVVISFLIGLAVTISATLWAAHGVKIESAFQFGRKAEQYVAEINHRVQRTGYGLMGARDLYMGSEYVSRPEFRAFVNSRSLKREFPGAIGVGVIDRVARDDLRRYEMDERKDAAPEYTIRSTSTNPFLYPVKFIEPLEANRQALGYDAGSDSLRGAIVEQAIESGEHTLTPPLILLQDDQERIGLLYFVPVYERGSEHDTPEARMKRLVCLIYSPILVEKLFEHFAGDTAGFLDVAVYDGAQRSSENMLFHTDSSQNDEANIRRRDVHSPRHTTIITETIGGRSWVFHLSSTPEFEASTRKRTPLLALVLGITLSILLSSLVWAFGLSRSHAFSLRLTQDLARTRAIADAEYKTELESRLLERTQELEAIQAELIKKERMAVLGQLIATVSHELRNPLGTIRASLFMLKKRSGGMADDFRTPLERAERNVRRCDHIIEELLDYTRIISVDTMMIQVADWITELERDFDFPDGVTVSTTIDDDVSIQLDPASVRRCVFNVWQNACDAMKAQADAHAECTLHVSCVQNGNRVEIKTTDNGSGISEENMKSIFEPLFTTKSFGVGLGLAIVSEIMEAHGGGIEVDSTVGEGTTVTLWLTTELHS